MTEKMPNEVDLKVINDRVVLEGFPENIKLRRLNYHSENLAMLKALSIASINIQASKFYMDSIRNSPREIDPHMFDAAILAAILKYGSVFKIDKKGKKIKPEVIFGQKIRILNRSVDERPIEIDDPNRAYLEHHRFFLDLRDKFIAHDDRIIGHTDCFATLDENFVCDQVLVLSRSEFGFFCN